MPDEVYRWRPVPKKHRCDRCMEEAAVVLENLYLCGGHFLEESKKRFGRLETKVAS